MVHKAEQHFSPPATDGDSHYLGINMEGSRQSEIIWLSSREALPLVFHVRASSLSGVAEKWKNAIRMEKHFCKL